MTKFPKSKCCLNFHTPMRFCRIGDDCQFIHVYKYKDKQVPGEIHTKIGNENKRRMYLNGIAKHYPIIAKKFNAFGTYHN